MTTRSFPEAVYLQARIRARHAAHAHLGLRVFAEHELSGHAPVHREVVAPMLDRQTMLALKGIWAAAAFFKQSPALQLAYLVGPYQALALAHRRVHRRLLAACEAHGPVRQGTAIPTYDWRRGSPEEFRARFVDNAHPVVLRGFAAAAASRAPWSFAELLARYGDEPVLLTRAERDGYEGRLREVDDPEVYVHNCEVLFRRDPELLAGLELERLEPYIGKRLGYAQLFVGRGGTGTPFHAAAVWNWFVMLDGRKTWYFVDPRDTAFLYPFPIMGKAATFALCLFPDEYDRDCYPAFAYCPYLTVTLEPGDVLLNPPWWWHAVRNASPTSIGVASRWHGDGSVGRDFLMTEEDYEISPLFSWLFQAGVASVPFMHRILRDPSPAADGAHTLRERNNRFVDRQRELATKTYFGSRMRF
jgi:hypothetical protein